MIPRMRHDADASDEHGLVIAQLSSLIDDELSGPTLAFVEAHLATCATCRMRLKELRAVKAWVSSDTAAAADHAAPAMWDELRARLPERGLAGRIGVRGRVSVAASLLVAAMAGAAWWTTRESGGSLPTANTMATSGAPDARATASLETVAHARLAALPAPTSQALMASLQILDGAIADARSASLADPGNEFVATYLDDLLTRKADALRAIIEMADAERTS